MSREQVSKSIVNKRLSIPRDWFGDSFGPLSLLIFCGISAVTVFIPASDFSQKFALWLFIAFGILFFYSVYCLARERDLALVTTALSTGENRQLVVSIFQKLGWNIMQNNQRVVRATTDSLMSQTATILIQENAIYLNVLHLGASRGRLPFSFGSNARKLRLLIKAIENEQLLGVC